MIDDLIRFCLAEIAYEGELGCSIERLKELISEFSSNITLPSTTRSTDTPNENSSDNKQNVDDAYCAYVYSLIARHPSIVIGTVPEGCPPVWIAPPPRKNDAQAPPPISLHVIEDGKSKSMAELIAQYGNVLRIAADKATCFLMLTGSHNRPTKLTDTVYTTLQIVTRAREKGVAIKDLGPMTGYDPKAIFYQISQLTELKLVVKVSKGPTLNWAVNKKFYDNSHFWHMLSVEPEAADAMQEANEDGEENDELEADLIGNIPLLRVRVLRLLEKSKNYTHQNHDLISSAGYRNPTKSQRRFFSSRINEMVDESLIERITVPGPRGNTVCVQMADAGKTLLEKIDQSSQQKDPDNEGELSYADVDDTKFPWTDTNLLLHRRGLQCQVIDLLKDSPKGLIIKDIHQALGFFDRRAIEQILARLCSRIPPRHLAHLHPVTVMETVGKMRRQRYFTLQHYQTLLKEQNITDERIDWVHLDEVGEFSYASPDMFWTNKTELSEFIARFQRSSGRQLQRSLKNPNLTPKPRKYKNPVINGVVAKGRPRKEWSQTNEAAAAGSKQKKKSSSKKRKKDAVDELLEFDDELADDDVEDEAPAVASTSRPRKKKKTVETTIEEQEVEQSAIPSGSIVHPSDTPRRAVEPQDSQSQKRDQRRRSTKATTKAVTSPHGDTGKRSQAPERASGPVEGPTRGLKRIAPAMQEGDEDYVSAQPSKRRRLEVEQEESLNTANLIRSTSIIAHPPTSPTPLPEDNAQSTAEQEPPIADVTMVEATPSESPEKKRRSWRSQPKPKATNLSDLRRQQDLLEVIKSHSGIMQLNHELSLLLRDKQADKGGSSGSAASFVSDKKTISKAAEGLQDKGEVKMFKTILFDSQRMGAIPQTVTIVHLFDLPQPVIAKFVTDLQAIQKRINSPSQPRQLAEGLEFTRRPRQPGERKEHETFDPIEYTQILGPRQRFLEDFQTVSQLFGFLLGKSRRCQELYLFTLSCILSDSPPSNVVSVSERIVATPYWTEDYPIGSFCAVIPVYSYVPYLETIQQDKEALNQPLKALDRQLYRVMKVGNTQTRTRLMGLLQALAALQLITPLEEDPWGSIVVGEGEEKRTFSPVKAMPTLVGELPPYWKFNRTVPLWLFGAKANAKDPLKFYKNMPMDNMEDAMAYWSLLQNLCSRAVDLSAYESSNELPIGDVPKIPESVVASLCSSKSWTSNYRLSKMQEEYLKKMIDAGSLTTPLNDPTSERLTKAAYVTCAPPDAVSAFFASQVKKISLAQEEIQERKKKADAAELAEMELERKAQQHLAALGEQWDQMVLEIKNEGLTEEETDRLVPLKSRYITVGGQVEPTKLKELIEAVLKDPVQDARNRYKTLETYEKDIARSIDVDRIEQAMPTIPPPPPQPRRFRGMPTPQHLTWEHSTAATFAPVAEPASHGRSAKSKPTGEDPESTTPKEYPPLPPRVQYGPRRPVREIIESMGPGPEGKKERQVIIAQNGREIVSRQKKFVWSVEYDELLCDAVAVIKARCRGKSKLITWSPIEALFPPLTHGRTRNRHKKWLTQPGTRKYMDRLILTWYNVWQQHKGRPELRDEDSSNPEGCDLISHVEFLRSYVDKKNLNEAPKISSDDINVNVAQSYIDLPSSLSALFLYYQMETEGDFVENTIDQYWGDITAGDAEKVSSLQSTAFSEPPTRILGPETLRPSLAESAIQMIVSTDQDDYDEEAATAALRPFGDDVIRRATYNLSKRGALNKVSKNGNGRIYRMSDQNAEDITGKLSLQRCQDAATLEKVFEAQPDEWRLWSLMPNEGEMAALLRRVADHQAEFQIQLPDLKQARDHAQWTSRKIQDDMIEAQIAVLFQQTEPDTPDLGSNFELAKHDKKSNHDQEQKGDQDDEGDRDQREGDHGVTITSEKASCLVNQPDTEFVNCNTCLRKALSVLEGTIPAQVASVDDNPMQLVSNIRQFLGHLQRAGDHGLTADEVWVFPDVGKFIDQLSSSPVPLAFWTGYNRCRLVSSHYLSRYAVWIHPPEQGGKAKADKRRRGGKLMMPKLVIPHRWVDMQGNMVDETWQAAQRATIGLLILKPRLQHNRLIDGLSKAYNRLDILYVLRCLEKAGMVHRVVDKNDTPNQTLLRSIEQITLEEESCTFWELGEDFDWQNIA